MFERLFLKAEKFPEIIFLEVLGNSKFKLAYIKPIIYCFINLKFDTEFLLLMFIKYTPFAQLEQSIGVDSEMLNDCFSINSPVIDVTCNITS